jgi:hypothetical protein
VAKNAGDVRGQQPGHAAPQKCDVNSQIKRSSPRRNGVHGGVNL